MGSVIGTWKCSETPEYLASCLQQIFNWSSVFSDRPVPGIWMFPALFVSWVSCTGWVSGQLENGYSCSCIFFCLFFNLPKYEKNPRITRQGQMCSNRRLLLFAGMRRGVWWGWCRGGSPCVVPLAEAAEPPRPSWALPPWPELVIARLIGSFLRCLKAAAEFLASGLKTRHGLPWRARLGFSSWKGLSQLINLILGLLLM